MTINRDYLLEATYDNSHLVEFIEDNYEYLTKKFGIDFTEVLGCGAFGCVFPTENPLTVAKFTRDRLELEYYKIIRDKSYASPLFPEIYLINNQFHHNPINWHLVMREAVIPMKAEDFTPENCSYIRDERDKIGLRLEDVKRANLGFSLKDGRIVLFDSQTPDWYSRK